MDVTVMQSPVGDSSKQSKKRRKRRSKNQAVENTGAENRDQMDGNLGASDNVANNKLKKDLLQTIFSLQPLSGNPKTDVGSIQNLSEGSANRKKKRKKKKKKATGKDEVENLDLAKATIKDDIQNMDLTKATIKDGVENLDLAKAAIKDDMLNMALTKMDTGSTENLDEENVTGKMKKKKCVKKPKNKEEIPSMDQTQMNTVTTGNIGEGNVTGKTKWSRKKSKNEKIKDEVQSMDQTQIDTGTNENLAEGDVTGRNINKAKTKDEVQSMSQTQIVTGANENLAEGNLTGKRKKKRKNRKKAENKDEAQSMSEAGSMLNLQLSDENHGWRLDGKLITDGTNQESEFSVRKEDGPCLSDHNMNGEVEKGLSSVKNDFILDPGKGFAKGTENLGERNVTGKRKQNRKKSKKEKIKDEVQSMDQTQIDTGTTENLVEGDVTGRNINKVKTKDEVQSMIQTQIVTGTNENLVEGNVTGKRKRKRKSRTKPENKDEAQSMSEAGSMLNLHLPDENDGWRIDGNLRTDGTNQEDGPCNGDHNINGEVEKGLSLVKNDFTLDPGNGFAKGRSVLSAYDVETTEHFSLCQVNGAECLYPKMGPSISIRRKLLVLDVNGLLADIIMHPPKHCRGDIRMLGRAIFRRPFCDEFLKFCFQNFDVGIWSSRTKKIIDAVVNFLLGDLKDKLLFCWDMSRCTQTGLKTLENRHKPLVCKDLRKIWENDDPNLPWKKGDYNESNTLMLDDSPYKALLNPLNTAIFPYSYCYQNKKDKSLGPGGDLRVYLEGLIKHEDLQKYVERHPFGQRAITEKHSSWRFYKAVFRRVPQRLREN